jgi:hypothetical protein
MAGQRRGFLVDDMPWLHVVYYCRKLQQPGDNHRSQQDERKNGDATVVSKMKRYSENTNRL